jgi:hypothetical protein
MGALEGGRAAIWPGAMKTKACEMAAHKPFMRRKSTGKFLNNKREFTREGQTPTL